MNFSSSPKSTHDPVPHFIAMAEGHGGEGCVMYASQSRAASLYDAARAAVVAVPPPKFCCPRYAFSFHITRREEGRPLDRTHGLYVLGKSGGETSFEVFNYGETENGPGERHQDLWCWERLPLWTPPHGGTLSSLAGHPWPWHYPSAAALVDDRTIFVSDAGSTDGGGTYAFDTVKREWRHAGDWALPIHGTARYAPELGLWFGLTGDSHGHRLWAFDLSPSSSSSSSSSPPTVLHSWEYLKRPPVGERWVPWHPQQLVYLGSGRFCIATSFLRIEKRKLVKLGAEQEVLTLFHELTVLTGVEVARSGGGDDGGHGLQMINHKSLRYNEIEDIRVHCVL